MSDDLDAKLKQALSEPDQYDKGMDRKVRKIATVQFNRRLKRAERIMWLYVNAFLWVALFALLRFLGSDNLKHSIGYAILILAAIEGHYLVKLWYAVVNTKLNISKALKQIQMEFATLASGEKPSVDLELEEEIRKGGALSRKERLLWLFGDIGIIALIVLFAEPSFQPGTVVKNFATVLPNGDVTVTSEMTVHNDGVAPMVEFPFYAPEDTEAHWYTNAGVDFPATRQFLDGSKTEYQVRMTQPIMPGESLSYYQEFKFPHMVKTEADGYEYNNSWNYGSTSKIRYEETVLLPRGAEVTNVEPSPKKVFTASDGTPVVKFEATTKRNEEFGYLINYSYPAEAAAQ